MRPYDLIIFDWDGTLMDSTPSITQAMQQAIQQLQLPPLSNDTVSHIIGLGLNEAVSTLYPSLPPARLQQLGQYYQRNFIQQQTRPQLFPGAADFIKHLFEQDYLLAVATGKSRSGLDSVLTQTQLAPYFTTTRCVDECPSKPDPTMLKEIITELGATAERTLMIGDTSHDLMMARHAGTSMVGITHGAHSEEKLVACTPDYITHDLKQLQTWLQKISLC
ncbi:MAG TPA: HAD family hydrolase [Gammaproteobacteria bacterium]|nr:HAD family hydrolase [Gammaproteobacteria bacterium]